MARGQAGLTWEEARVKCLGEDATLIEIDGEQEKAFLNDFARAWSDAGVTDRGAKYWIGELAA